MDCLILVAADLEIMFAVKHTPDHHQVFERGFVIILVAKLRAGAFN